MEAVGGRGHVVQECGFYRHSLTWKGQRPAELGARAMNNVRREQGKAARAAMWRCVDAGRRSRGLRTPAGPRLKRGCRSWWSRHPCGPGAPGWCDVVAILEQVGGEAVAKRVGSDGLAMSALRAASRTARWIEVSWTWWRRVSPVGRRGSGGRLEIPVATATRREGRDIARSSGGRPEHERRATGSGCSTSVSPQGRLPLPRRRDGRRT
jgi:hypothetical protein